MLTKDEIENARLHFHVTFPEARKDMDELCDLALKGLSPEALEPEPVAWIVHGDYPYVTMMPPVEGGLPRTPLYKRSTPQK